MGLFSLRLLAIICSTIILAFCSNAVAQQSFILANTSTAAKKIIRSFNSTAGTGVFLDISDIHFNPFADVGIVKMLNASPVSKWSKIFAGAGDTQFSPYGSDTNYPLASSVVQAAKSLNLNYDFILISGDYLSHDFRATYDRLVGGDSKSYDQFVVKTMKYVSDLISDEFGGVPVFGTLGNNDAICGDYMLSPKSPLLTELASQWGKLAQQPAAFVDFSLGGSYKVKYPAVPNHDIIALNNIYWSTQYEDSCNTGDLHPGDALMAWLEWQLYQSKYQGHTVTLLMHIPPGINAYSTSKGAARCPIQPQTFWQDKYTTRFLSLLHTYRGVITNVFAGHTHMDNFRVITVPQGSVKIPVYITPSVSPIFDNNPAFKVILYDKTNAAVLNSVTFVVPNLGQASKADPGQWDLEYIFSSAYSLPDLSATSLYTLYDDIGSNVAIRSTFMKFYAASTPNGDPMTAQNWKIFNCAQTNITKANFEQCYCPQTP